MVDIKDDKRYHGDNRIINYMNIKKLNIAVIVPCYNESATIGIVVKDFRKILPNANVYVYDNNSNDDTANIAKKAGALTRRVYLPGKGNVVRRMFADVDADIYVMLDGDATYDAESAPKLIDKLLEDDLDMVVGCRVEEDKDNNNYRKGHRLGNKLLTGSVAKIFGGDFKDMLSGYRVFSRRFAKSFAAESKGFEIETELTVHTLELRLPYAELDTPYFERPEGSESKLSTYKDGVKILLMIARLYSNERPAHFWGIFGFFIIVVAAAFSLPVFIEYIQTDKVERFPTLIVASGLVVIGFLSFTIGLVLRTVTKGRKEAKHLAYLSLPSTKSIYEKR